MKKFHVHELQLENAYPYAIETRIREYVIEAEDLYDLFEKMMDLHASGELDIDPDRVIKITMER